MNCGFMRIYLSSVFTSRGHFSSGGRLQVVDGVLMVLTPEGWRPVSVTPEVETAPLSGEMGVHFSAVLRPDESLQPATGTHQFSVHLTPSEPTTSALDRIYFSIGE